MPTRSPQTVIIANAASLSGAVDLASGGPFAIQMPASWSAAALTFQGSTGDGVFQDVYDEFGVEVTVQAAAARFIILSPAKFLGLRFLKIRSGTTGTPVSQGAARSLQIIAAE